ncbi:hypothetical protein JHK84_045275 [Glycine max]|nr:hypothetical protein JHK84_045275 [Glycine max]
MAISAARGLAFLHSSNNHVIFRDFKPLNILLDENYNAKISDFGLARLESFVGKSHVTTRITCNYQDHGHVWLYCSRIQSKRVNLYLWVTTPLSV